MRDINRIDIICDRLREVWKKTPDMRLGQLICSISNTSSALFYIEDDKLQELIDKWETEHLREQTDGREASPAENINETGGSENMEDHKTVEIFSEKYGVHGKIVDYSFLIKLFFSYNGREHVIGIGRPFRKELSEVGLRIMENTIERLLGEPQSVYLHYWHVAPKGEFLQAHGIVTGHKKLPDTISIHTSAVFGIEIDAEHGEAVINTANTVYHCPLRYCDFKHQDNYPDILPDYEAIKAEYKDKIEYPEIEHGKVLLVLSDFDDYYFHSLCVNDGNGEKLGYTSHAHIGTFQDSFLIWGKEQKIDIRYFPHYKNIAFYSMDTDGMPLYAENIGRSVIYITDMERNQYRLEPGERKEITKENAEEEKRDLPDGDFYPVPVMF